MFKPRVLLWARAVFYHLSSGLSINLSSCTGIFSWLRFVVVFVPFVNCLPQMTSFFLALIMALKLTQYKILFSNNDGNVNGNDKERTTDLDRQNNNSARASRFFCTFPYRHYTTKTWKCLISRFVVNTRRLCFSFSELRWSLYFNSRNKCQHLTNWTRWKKHN